MNGHEIRETFLAYFEKNGHKRVHSSPLLPANDPTLLFINAGMNQFKDVFLGNEKRDYTRAASSQKCLRAGGKHNDLDEVGKTARHHTFFEMLGNFSFGDYFKEDAINFAWDFLVNELGLEKERLWFSVFEGDESVPADVEAEELWIKAGAPKERVLRFGKKDNFWQMGDTGPCGPCSEIHYYMGEDPSDPEKNSADLVNNDEGDTTMEIWNLVFMQFDKDADGNLAPLPAPSVDTGMGLERVAAVLQGVSTNYETDLIKPIVDFVASLSDHQSSITNHQSFACRVIADHARSTAFSIADGILPGNEGRNYVLRKIMRRAIYHGREHLGLTDAFFYKVCDFVIDEMKAAYPELEVQRDFIAKMVRLEEERFGNTLTVGLTKLNELLAKTDFTKGDALFAIDQNLPDKEDLKTLLKDPKKMIAALDQPLFKESFWDSATDSMREKLGSFDEFIEIMKTRFEDPDTVDQIMDLMDSPPPPAIITKLVVLYDTYGVPKDLIRLKLEEKLDFVLPENVFERQFDEALLSLQQDGDIGKTHRAEKINPIYKELEEAGIKSEFRGYDTTTFEGAEIIAIVKENKRVDALNEGDEGLIVLNETPFYAESGGQVGDNGSILSSKFKVQGSKSDHKTLNLEPGTLNSFAQAKVLDTFAPIAGIVLHKSKIEKGKIEVGDKVDAHVDVENRDATRRNHTATHLVHAALKEVLGTHVKQAGSVVAPGYLRFDFTHYQAMSDVELNEVEDLVNYHILRNEPVATDLMSIEEAMRSGAVAMFGEKYGSDVRVLSVGNGGFSKELCGGTHVRATGDIGSFKITADEAIASGVRRIRAITGFDAFRRFREDERLIDDSLNVLRTQRDQLPAAIGKLQDELKQTRKEIDDLKLKIATGAVGVESKNGDEAKEINGVKVLAKVVDDLDRGGMRHLSDSLMAQVKSGVVIIGNKNDGKVSLIVRVSDDLTSKVKAGSIIGQIAPIVGGRGGGKPDMAEGGGTETGKLDEAIEASYSVIETMLGN